MEILKYCTDCDEIQFKEDGSWAPMRSKKEVQEVTTSYNGVDGKLCFGTCGLNVLLLDFNFDTLIFACGNFFRHVCRKDCLNNSLLGPGVLFKE